MITNSPKLKSPSTTTSTPLQIPLLKKMTYWVMCEKSENSTNIVLGKRSRDLDSSESDENDIPSSSSSSSSDDEDPNAKSKSRSFGKISVTGMAEGRFKHDNDLKVLEKYKNTTFPTLKDF